jgi:hypothetical protein
MHLERHGIKSVRNTIVILDNGERVDLRKANVGKIQHQGRREGTNKYGARSAEYQGVTYHSTAEAKYASQLNLRLLAKEIKGWERQVKIPLYVYGQLISTYYADFRITHKDGTVEIVETKGYFSEYARLKWKMFTAIYENEHPEIKITMIRV